ncbi:MAG: prolyl-tRNA synthetase associated domain-containing protein [SAR324 cluster bacterium]|nr:prolyl-tRNA synthetase associated domain-containing protein [SAR324 cluster bacterium]
MQDIYELLDEHEISYEQYDHPALMTTADAQKFIPHLPGAPTKNLFLRDKKGSRHFLVVVHDFKQVELKSLSEAIGSSRLSFGSPERLKKHLNIEPGSVSLLALSQDIEKRVELFIDKPIWEAELLQCHPLINTRTLVISHSGIEKFLTACGSEFSTIDVPGIEE